MKEASQNVHEGRSRRNALKRDLIIAAVFLSLIGGAVFVITKLRPPVEEEPGFQAARRVRPGIGVEEVYEDTAFLGAASLDEASLAPLVELEAGEVLVRTLTENFDSTPAEEQVILYRDLNAAGNPIAITYVEAGEEGVYRRVWSGVTIATQPNTVSLSTLDLVGDRSVCVIVGGMNVEGDQTLTVFRKKPVKTGAANARQELTRQEPVFEKIAEIRMDGLVVIKEENRTQAYQNGIAGGKSFDIEARGHDGKQKNPLDQVVITYSWNAKTGVYAQAKYEVVSGEKVEEGRLRSLLDGGKQNFEQFIDGLWYYTSPAGTVDADQFIFFDPEKREIIFYGDKTQQVFTWLSSASTRLGLQIAAQNDQVASLRRFLNVDLASLDSISLRVAEDVRMRVLQSSTWNGKYKRADNLSKTAAADGRSVEKSALEPYLDAVFDSALGVVTFTGKGEYTIVSTTGKKEGRYVFYTLSGLELLTLLPAKETSGAQNTESRGTEPRENATYLVKRVNSEEGGAENDSLSLTKVRLGTRGVQDEREGQWTLTRREVYNESEENGGNGGNGEGV